ncbi:hypothetical protein BU24DRAFT_468217 [Aaosphaeria arxii CBS 175.79]|uniref:Uncharacterized protein n=1 Tax=Aaosphaeria arxii CBS 175.79 TaxID=1450172 RepID=A0A6A5X8V5_9PLEO|nr:uncharacterized protein BU24DRAFT_468217 [Aaosphaeria arxii CBS 175.79]KAF2009237.1 hypothetical protein BU24DRAFT_468217 [Aaosphaeria arxii CBS 175.79]
MRSRVGERGLYRLLGFGGGGFGVPVVSYAPRPMLEDSDSLRIILKFGLLWNDKH